MRDITLEHYARLRSQRVFNPRIARQRARMWRHNGMRRRLESVGLWPLVSLVKLPF